MTKFFLSLHVLAAVLAIGPVTVAASMFPKFWRRAQADPGDATARTVLATLHRICRVYAAIGLAVPLLGFATASSLGVLGSAWLIVSIVLTTVAGGVLLLLILPGQQNALEALGVPDGHLGAEGAASGVPSAGARTAEEAAAGRPATEGAAAEAAVGVGAVEAVPGPETTGARAPAHETAPAPEAQAPARETRAPAPEAASARGRGPGARTAAGLAMSTGVFNLLWATVTVLMIVRPGSTTGA
ncbi:integral membrane protein [Streptomyces albus]|uniref:Integral membrane protein n=1 Tax=Streptomyces albus (strain ATCC 21838 / DSM 41398 / FERM P-419 / JCM 4703 / NBRC 107858) TaxID=1081613 RepID=A0A0B5ET67_STRA4|nr:integral membrane protein [Streptomyces albus]AOU79171.1 integral membrane protein [Streptomyces albus]